MPESRPVTIPSGGLTLEGLLHLPETTPAPGIVICHPHPQYGGDMQNNVVSAVCETAVASGVAALRFNFRGVGASEGAHTRGTGEVEDARAALDYLRVLPEIDSARLALAGYSFGAVMALLAAAGEDVRALLAVSLPTIEPLPKSGPSCPARFVSGDEDEYADVEELKAFVLTLGPEADLKLIPGLGHFWFGVERDLQNIVEPFLTTHLLGIPTA